MKKQIIFINGGDSFNTYEEYIEELKKYNVSLERFKAKKWRESLGKKLGEDFDVIVPKMPNPNNVKYLEWKIMFEKIIPLLSKNVILIGHSLGGIFLIKYLSDNILRNKPLGLFIISAPYKMNSKEFKLDYKNINKIENQSENIFMYHSKDDEVVNFKDFLEYKKLLSKPKFKEFKNRGHFNQPTFPEIVKDIKSI